MDESRVDPFVVAFSVEVLPEEPHQPWGTAGPHVSQVGGIPNVKEVRQAEWGVYDFDEYSAVLMRHGDEDDRVDMFINMDNLYLRNELVKRRALGEDLVRSWFKYGLLVLCLGMLYRQRQDGLRRVCVAAVVVSPRSAESGLPGTVPGGRRRPRGRSLSPYYPYCGDLAPAWPCPLRRSPSPPSPRLLMPVFKNEKGSPETSFPP